MLKHINDAAANIAMMINDAISWQIVLLALVAVGLLTWLYEIWRSIRTMNTLPPGYLSIAKGAMIGSPRLIGPGRLQVTMHPNAEIIAGRMLWLKWAGHSGAWMVTECTICEDRTLKLICKREHDA